MADTCFLSRHDRLPAAGGDAGISPLIWRRLVMPAGTTIAELHAIVQTVFGWSGEHLHRFVIHGTEYGISYVGGPGFRDDARQVRLGELGLRQGERFAYEYNFSAAWRVRPARRADRLRPAGTGLPALHRRAARRPTRGLGRAVGVPGADPAAPGVRRDRTRCGDHRPAARRRRTSRPSPASASIATNWPRLVPLLGLERFDRRACNQALAACRGRADRREGAVA